MRDLTACFVLLDALGLPSCVFAGEFAVISFRFSAFENSLHSEKFRVGLSDLASCADETVEVQSEITAALQDVDELVALGTEEREVIKILLTDAVVGLVMHDPRVEPADRALVVRVRPDFTSLGLPDR